VAKLNLAPTNIGPISGLSQATVVVGALAVAWVLWLAVNNKLIVYWAILMGAGGAPGQTAPGQTTGGGIAGGPSSGNTTSVTGTPGASATTTVTPTGAPSVPALNTPVFGGTEGTGYTDPLSLFGF